MIICTSGTFKSATLKLFNNASYNFTVDTVSEQVYNTKC